MPFLGKFGPRGQNCQCKVKFDADNHSRGIWDWVWGFRLSFSGFFAGIGGVCFGGGTGY